jgi:phospholipid/cholesterol/gamma-HCH transport system substrate-binding protein
LGPARLGEEPEDRLPEGTPEAGTDERSPSTLGRVAAVGSLVAAVVLVAFLMFGSSGEYRIKARFENAGQVVNGGLVEIAGKQVGTISDQRLTDDGVAELTLSIDEEWGPIPRGTHAQIRQFGLSAPASRYVELRLPHGERRGNLRDGDVLGLDSTTAHVDIDTIFTIFNKRTRESLKGVYRGSARQYRSQGRNANEGWLYLDPAFVSASRLFRELDRDEDSLRRFLNESSRLVGDVAERRDDLAGLVSNLADTTGAIARPRPGLAEAINRLPPFMRQANTTYVNLRAAFDDLDPLVNDAKPVAKELRPYTRELRRFVVDAEPTIKDLAAIVARRGRDNDLVELNRAIPPLRDIAVGPVRRNGKKREGALPESAEALAHATPRVAFARPYSVDFTGWLDDFSHTGVFDALGGFSRVGQHVNAFTFKNGVLEPLAPSLRGQQLKDQLKTGQTDRCPGAIERDPGDGSTPWKPYPDFPCDPRQIPVGR